MKKRLKIFVITVLFILSCIGATYAYFTYLDSAENVFEVGTNTIEVDEDYEPPEEITTGETRFLKTVRIKNTGTIPCFIRMFCEFSDSDIEKYTEVLVGDEWIKAEDLHSAELEDWVYIPEEDGKLGGYFYYTKPVEPDESTKPIFKEVKVTIPSTEGDKAKDFDIIVYSESVQIKDYNGNDYADGWMGAWNEFIRGGD